MEIIDFSLVNYMKSPLYERERAFYTYLLKKSLAISTAYSYSNKICVKDEFVSALVKEYSGKDSIYEVVDEHTLSCIYLKARDKKSAIRHYRDFILHLSQDPYFESEFSCDAISLLFSCIETMHISLFTKRDLLNYIPVFKTVFPYMNDYETFIDDSLTALAENGHIDAVGHEIYKINIIK